MPDSVATQRRILIPVELAKLPPPLAGGQLESLQGITMGTTWMARFFHTAALPSARIREGLQGCLDLVVQQMSTWLEDSDLVRFNRADANTWHVLPMEFFTVLEQALALARATDGAYDPACAALVDLWGFGPASRRASAPSAAEVQEARLHGDWRQLRLEPAHLRALQPGGLQIDLSSIAKGYAVDLLAQWLQAHGIHHFLVEVGGELRGHGFKHDGQPWWVGLEQPLARDGQALTDLAPTMIALHGLAVATSGDYRRYFEDAGQRYSHTIDPRRGTPITHDLASVSVLHPQCMLADGLATALMVLGLEQGMQLARRMRLPALFVTREGQGVREHLSPAMQDMLS